MASALLRTAWCLLALLLSTSLGLAWAWLLAGRLRQNIKFDLSRSEMEELQAPMSDSAFYLSFYYDVARAPSLAVGLQRLLADERSEAPDTVNALHKFNVLPELLVAALHRVSGSSLSPYGFYVASVVTVTGMGVAALALTAALLGESLVCSVLVAAFYMALCYSPSLMLGTRLHAGTFALREFWGVPLLLLQNAALVLHVKGGGRPRWAVLACGTCLFELAWQFAPFVLLLQVLSLLGAYVLGALGKQRLGAAALAASAGTVAALLLSFGNGMLLCSPFFALASSVAAVAFAPAPFAGLAEQLWVLAAALACGAGAQQLLKRAIYMQEDAHVLQLLLQKLGLAPEESSFDANIYLQSPEFGFLNERYVREATTALALPAAAAAALLILVATGRHALCGRKGEEEPAAWTAQTLFLVALLLLALLVDRLRVIAAPVLCLLGSLLASPQLWGRALHRGWLPALLAYALGGLLVPASLKLSGAPERLRDAGELLADRDMQELVMWVNSSLPSDALVMADMTMAAKFRMISPTLRLSNHPQYESVTSRQRNRAYYRTFTCMPPDRVHAVLKSYNVTHVLLNANACKARMGKLDAYEEKRDRCGSVPLASLQKKSFCWAGFLASGPGQFELAFRNPVYTVLRVLDAPAPAKRGNPKEIVRAETWLPWLLRLRDASAARGLARAAVRWPQMYGGEEVAEALLRKAEELAPKDPIVLLQRGDVQLSAGHPKAAATLARAAELARAPEDVHDVFAVRKALFNREGPSAAGKVAAAAKGLQAHWQATQNAFDLCDVGGWLRDLGKKAQAKAMWEAAKRINAYDQCVREDWGKWEGRERGEGELWRAFLRLP